MIFHFSSLNLTPYLLFKYEKKMSYSSEIQSNHFSCKSSHQIDGRKCKQYLVLWQKCTECCHHYGNDNYTHYYFEQSSSRRCKPVLQVLLPGYSSFRDTSLTLHFSFLPGSKIQFLSFTVYIIYFFFIKFLLYSQNWYIIHSCHFENLFLSSSTVPPQFFLCWLSWVSIFCFVDVNA